MNTFLWTTADYNEQQQTTLNALKFQRSYALIIAISELGEICSFR